MSNYLEWIITGWELCWLNVLSSYWRQISIIKRDFLSVIALLKLLGEYWIQAGSEGGESSCQQSGGLVISQSSLELCCCLPSVVQVHTSLLSPHLLCVSQCRPVKISQQFWQKLIPVKTRELTVEGVIWHL